MNLYWSSVLSDREVPQRLAQWRDWYTSHRKSLLCIYSISHLSWMNRLIAIWPIFVAEPQIYKGDPRTYAIFIPAWGSNSNWGYSGFSRDQNNRDSSGVYVLWSEHGDKHTWKVARRAKIADAFCLRLFPRVRSAKTWIPPIWAPWLTPPVVYKIWDLPCISVSRALPLFWGTMRNFLCKVKGFTPMHFLNECRMLKNTISRNFCEKIFSGIWLKQTFREFLFSTIVQRELYILESVGPISKFTIMTIVAKHQSAHFPASKVHWKCHEAFFFFFFFFFTTYKSGIYHIIKWN